ncbi:MAG: 1-deoxy-D-xylulose-5-phosphate reductoisomerase [Crocinitomicaceae bacterium]|nr:1-deoxy-D-xylulose-5-phosphate reductoisomerase [Crocinitomicaceae bacterium]
MSDKKKIAILGSTGSIGTQALEVISAYPDKFEVSVLTANNNADLLIQQALKFKPNVVVISNEDHYQKVEEVLWQEDVKTYTGADALEDVVQMDEVDIVLAGIVGFAGLKPTIKAIEAGKNIALANKETLVVAGAIITELAQEKGVNIYPVDSEHSAIFQCIVGEFQNPIEKIYLTASGGPFRGKSIADLENVSREEALNHPNWNMGDKVTIDSATMMNKGLEVIEAKWLFGLKPNQIDVIVHPESVVHSLVQFQDGSIKAQLGLPDMKLPIQFAFSYPQRFPSNSKRLDFAEFPSLHFEAPDKKVFTNLQLAYDVIEKSGNMPAVLNAANEITVEHFLNNKIKFLQIAEINAKVCGKINHVPFPDLTDLLEADREARRIAEELCKY